MSLFSYLFKKRNAGHIICADGRRVKSVTECDIKLGVAPRRSRSQTSALGDVITSQPTKTHLHGRFELRQQGSGRRAASRRRRFTDWMYR